MITWKVMDAVGMSDILTIKLVLSNILRTRQQTMLNTLKEIKRTMLNAS